MLALYSLLLHAALLLCTHSLLRASEAYVILDTTLELNVTATTSPVTPFTQSVTRSNLLSPLQTSLSMIQINGSQVATDRPSPCYFDLPSDTDDDFSSVATNPAGPERDQASALLLASAWDSERHMYYANNSRCSFFELVGTHNLPLRISGKASVSKVDVGYSPSSARWSTGQTTEQNTTMVVVAAVKVRRYYMVDDVTQIRAAAPYQTTREPARGIFLRLVGLSTVSQSADATEGTSMADYAPDLPLNATKGPAPYFTDAQKVIAIKMIKGVRALLRRVVTDQEALDALWGPRDVLSDEATFEDATTDVLRVVQESPAILFDDGVEAADALSQFANFSNFTSLLAWSQNGNSTAETLLNATARSLSFRREALNLFASWMLLNNNNLRGTTGYTDVNGMAEFPNFRGLGCTKDTILWAYVRRQVPGLSVSDVTQGVKDVNRTVVLGDTRLTLRPVANTAYVLSHDGSEEGGMTWEGALLSHSDAFYESSTVSRSLQRTLTRTRGLDGSTEATTTATTLNVPFRDGGVVPQQEYPTMTATLKPSAPTIARNMTKDMGELQETLRFLLIDSCGRSVDGVGRLSLGSPATTEATAFSRPSLNANRFFSSGFIGAVVSPSKRVSVDIPLDIFSNITNIQSPRHRTYALNYVRDKDYATGLTWSSVSVPNITINPRLTDRGYMFRFDADEPEWSLASNRMMRNLAWRSDRPWSLAAYEQLSIAADKQFRVPSQLLLWGIEFDSYALVQNTSRNMVGQVDFRLGVKADTTKGLQPTHGGASDAAISQYETVDTRLAYTPYSNPLGFGFASSSVSNADTAPWSEGLPSPLQGFWSTTPSGRGEFWSPLFLTMASAFPSGLLYSLANKTNTSNREPYGIEYMMQAAGARNSDGLESWRYANDRTYVPRPTWASARQATKAGSTYRATLSSKIHSMVTSDIAAVVKIRFTFSAQPARATRPQVTSEAIPIEFDIDYGNTLQPTLVDHVFSTDGDGNILSRVFPITGLEEATYYNTFQKTLLPLYSQKESANDVSIGVAALKSRKVLSASTVAKKGLVISWTTPLNILSDSIRSANDLRQAVKITSSQAQAAAPRAFTWASPSIEPQPIGYAVKAVPRPSPGRNLQSIFFFNATNNSLICDSNRSSAFLIGIDFVHQLFLPPLSSYFTLLEEEITVALQPALLRAPYNLKYTNFSFVISATEVSSAEKLRDWLSLLGMWSRTSSVGTISAVTSVASCSTDSGMPLDLALHPSYLSIGDGPARYFVGAVIMNTVLIVAFSAIILLSGRFTKRLGIDSFPNETIILTFLLYPGTAVAGMNALKWLNDTTTGIRYLVMVIAGVYILGFPILFFVLGVRRRSTWEQTKRSETGKNVDANSLRQQKKQQKIKRRLQKETLLGRKKATNQPQQSTVDRLLGTLQSKLAVDQALSLLKFFIPEGHYIVVHNDHVRYYATYDLYRGPVVNFVIAELIFPFLISLCAFLDCPANAYTALIFIILHIAYTFITHPHITLGRNLIVFASDVLLIVATGLQIRGDENVSRRIYIAASIICSCANIIGLLVAVWCHRLWRATVKNWHKKLRVWIQRGHGSRRARVAACFLPLTTSLLAHLDGLYSGRPEIIYRNQRRLVVMNQMRHNNQIAVQEGETTVELNAVDLIRGSAGKQMLGIELVDSEDSLDKEFVGSDRGSARSDEANRRKAYNRYKNDISSTTKPEMFFDNSSFTMEMAQKINLASAASGRSRSIGPASQGSGSTKGLLHTPLLDPNDTNAYSEAMDDASSYDSNGGVGGAQYGGGAEVFVPVALEDFYNKPENRANRAFDPFKLKLEDARGGPGTLQGYHSKGDDDIGDDVTLTSLSAPSPPAQRLGPSVLPPMRARGSFIGCFDGSSRLGLPDRGGTAHGGDGHSVEDRSAILDGRSGYSYTRRAGAAGFDRLSHGSAGERNALVDRDRMRDIVTAERVRFETANEARLQQYVYGSRREVMTNPQGTLIAPELPDEDELTSVSNNGTFVKNMSGVGIGIGRGRGGAEVSWADAHLVDDDMGMASTASFSKRQFARIGRRGMGNSNDYGDGYNATASPPVTIGQRALSRSTVKTGLGGTHAFGKDDDEGAVVHLFLTPQGMQESRVANNAVERIKHINGNGEKGEKAVEGLVTKEVAKRVRGSYNSNIYSHEEMVAWKTAWEHNRKMRQRHAGVADAEVDAELEAMMPIKDAFGRYRKRH